MKQWIPALFSPCVSILSGHKKTIASSTLLYQRCYLLWWSLQDLNRVVAGFVSFASALWKSGLRILSLTPPLLLHPKKLRFSGALFTGGHRFRVSHKTKEADRKVCFFSWWSLQDLNLWPPARQTIWRSWKALIYKGFRKILRRQNEPSS